MTKQLVKKTVIDITGNLDGPIDKAIDYLKKIQLELATGAHGVLWLNVQIETGKEYFDRWSQTESDFVRIVGDRLETDEEEADRINKENVQKTQREASERAMLAQLQAKYKD